MKVNAVLPRLRDLLRTDSDENVRAACARAVGELHDHESLSLLEAALEDHPTVKFQAIIGLGKLGNAAAGPYLLALLGRRTARNSISGSEGPRAAEAGGVRRTCRTASA